MHGKMVLPILLGFMTVLSSTPVFAMGMNSSTYTTTSTATYGSSNTPSSQTNTTTSMGSPNAMTQSHSTVTGSSSVSSSVYGPSSNASGHATENFGSKVEMAVHQLLAAGKSPAHVVAQFSDVGSVPWASDAIAVVSAEGLMKGTGQGQFSPNGSVQRDQMATVLTRILSAAGTLPQATLSSSELGSIPSWAKTSMSEAVALGIMNGTGQGLDASGNVTRAQAVVMIIRALGLQAKATALNSDSLSLKTHTPVPSWAQGSLALAIKLGLLTGVNGYVDASGTLTRAELAVLLQRVLSLVNTSSSTSSSTATTTTVG